MDTPQANYLKDYRPPAFLVDTVDLVFELKETDTTVTSTLALRRNPPDAASPDAPEKAPLVLDGRDMELVSVRMDGNALPPGGYQLDADTLTVPHAPDAFTLEITTKIQPQDNASLEGLYRSGGMFCTQCEAEGFRRITYFPDRPDVMAAYTVTLIADRSRCPVLLSNGNRVDGGLLEDGSHWVKWEDPFKKPCYLFALVAGDLFCLEDAFRTRSGRTVALRIYVEHENRDKCGYAMEALKKAMTWDEEAFGLEYDLDDYMIVAVNDFNMGAMENKGLNIFNSKFVLARQDTATDVDFWNIDRVIAHEYFHNWTGNRVTLRNWFQLSLKEGLTVFRDQEFSSDMTSRPVKRISDVRTLRAFQFPEDAGPMAHPVRPASYIKMDNFYTVTVYEKGAEVIRMIHTILGPEDFRKGMDLYFTRHDGQAVTIEDFVGAMADASGRDLAQFMRWYSQAGTPVITAGCRYDPVRKEYTLTFSQSCPPTPDMGGKAPMHIPVAVGLIAPDGKDLPLQLAGEKTPGETTRVLNLRAADESFTFVNVPAPPVPSILRGFSAPVKLRAGTSDAEALFRFAHDSDPFNRWDAGQTLFAKVMISLAGDFQQQRPLKLDDALVAAFRRTLLDETQDRAFLSHALTLPGESELATLMSESAPIDPEALHQARRFVTRSLAGALQEEFLTVLVRNQDEGPYAVDPASVGRRSLKNTTMAYIGLIETPEAVRRVYHQFESARNMTDEMAALAILSHIPCGERVQAMERFYERWRQDVLVLDKWFTIQAGAQLPDTPETVRRLLAHPDFSIKNPNKVRALIGAFCSLNPWCFHSPSGEGYALLAEQVIALDAFNPMIAARMVGMLNHWKKYEPVRRDLMKAQLERLMALPSLSGNVYEIVSKALA
ncbi:aminopeptidase N [Desulfococcus sp.]|uniref:aminopeptidase N n=1 Tax=Desulfococcus sp. TaxID=2025834 RepID=UPI00359412DD